MTHGGVARELGLLLRRSAGARIARAEITELQFGSPAEGIQVGRCDTDWTPVAGGSLKTGVPQARRGRGRTGWVLSGRQGGRSRGRNDGRRQSWPLDSRRSDSTPGRWSRPPAGPEAIFNSRWRNASGSGCSSARPGGDAAQRRQDSQRVRVVRRRRGGRGGISDGGDISSL